MQPFDLTSSSSLGHDAGLFIEFLDGTSSLYGKESEVEEKFRRIARQA